jgi:SAM-dependent methyltransferase
MFVATDRNRKLGAEGFPYHRCPACRLVFLHPIPADLGAYYPPDYYPVPASLEALRVAAGHEQFKLDLLSPYARSGSLLEIGPAFGNFAFLAKEAGFDVEVVEMDPRCCAFLQSVVGVRAIQSTDAAAAIRDRGPFDVVALWHVIEHVPDFAQLLTALAAKLKPGGHLILAAPNPDAFQFRVLGPLWTHLDAPRHVVLIPPSVLIEHLGRSGLVPAGSTMTDPGGRGWDTFGWQESLAAFATPGILRTALRAMGTAVARIARFVERDDRRGTAYTLVFRKELAR